MKPVENKLHIIFMAGALALLLGWGLHALLQLRLRQGDVYPPYSSLRGDPLGIKAWFEALARMDGLTVERNFNPGLSLMQDADKTIVVAGLAPDAATTLAEIRAVESFIARGGRLVMAFQGSRFLPRRPGNMKTPDDQEKEERSKTEAVEPNPTTTTTDTGEHEDETPPKLATQNDAPDHDGADKELGQGQGQPWSKAMKTRWGMTVAADNWRETGMASRQARLAAATASTPELPPELPWHLNLTLSPADESLIPGWQWQTIYEREGKAVVVEGKLQRGSVVFCSESYLLSNEAMRKNRFPAFLVWLLDGKSHVVFDETHLGLHQREGVAELGRRYGLVPAVVMFIILAMLYAWHSSYSVLPPVSSESVGTDETTAAGSAGEGFTALLRRHLPAGEIVPVCIGAWAKSLPAADPTMQKLIHEVREMPEAAPKATPVEAYNQISLYLQSKTELKKYR